MATAINKRVDPDDAQRLLAAASVTLGGLLRLQVSSNKIEHIAKELFGAHVEKRYSPRAELYCRCWVPVVPGPGAGTLQNGLEEAEQHPNRERVGDAQLLQTFDKHIQDLFVSHCQSFFSVLEMRDMGI